jgi:hypothetical protein
MPSQAEKPPNWGAFPYYHLRFVLVEPGGFEPPPLPSQDSVLTFKLWPQVVQKSTDSWRGAALPRHVSILFFEGFLYLKGYAAYFFVCPPLSRHKYYSLNSQFSPLDKVLIFVRHTSTISKECQLCDCYFFCFEAFFKNLSNASLFTESFFNKSLSFALSFFSAIAPSIHVDMHTCCQHCTDCTPCTPSITCASYFLVLKG